MTLLSPLILPISMLAATNPMAPPAAPPAATQAASPTPRQTIAVPAPVGRDIEARRDELTRAVSEIESCCAGKLELAPLEARRRWAVALYGWLVLTGCKPDPEGF